jgi:inosine-uridine nucleoside N-ribohydrolase
MSEPSKPRIIIDCDPGHDDAVAIILAQQSAEVLGITTVSGNAPLDHVSRNALAITELIGLAVPVHAGAAHPLSGAAHHAPQVHGVTGLGGTNLPTPVGALASEDAVGYLLSATQESAPCHLVAIGPLTNVALALQRDPTLAERLAGISIMGGSTSVGNVTRKAEFNIWADPEAASVVFSSGARLQMCGLNLTHQLQTSDAHIAELRAMQSAKASFVADLFEHLHGRMAEIIGVRASALHDPCAVLAVTAPQLLEFEDRAVSVELQGTLTRGMTVVDERSARRRDPANVAVAYQIDAAQAMRCVLAACH